MTLDEMMAEAEAEAGVWAIYDRTAESARKGFLDQSLTPEEIERAREDAAAAFDRVRRSVFEVIIKSVSMATVDGLVADQVADAERRLRAEGLVGPALAVGVEAFRSMIEAERPAMELAIASALNEHRTAIAAGAILADGTAAWH